MKKNYLKLLTLGALCLFFSRQMMAQAINNVADWTNASWTIGGTYNATSLLADPTIDGNLSYDDDGAGSGSTDSISVVSPIIDITAAQTAGENSLFYTFEYNYNLGDIYKIQYWDADALIWVDWDDAPDNSTTTSNWCANTSGLSFTGSALDISVFTATQLSGFQYRILYDASSVYGWGFCMTPPTLYSVGCLPPSNLTAISTASSSADLSWTENGSASSWQIEYGTTGFTQGTGTLSVVGNDTTTVSLLTPVTTYDFYVRAICGPGDTSTWVGPMSFTTTCVAVIAPWTEAFENGGTIPTCWNQGTGNAEPWKFSNTPGSNHIGNSGTIVGATTSGGYFAWVDDSSPQSMGTTLESPLIDVSALIIPQLSFYLISNNEGNTNVDFSIDVFDGSTWHVGFFTHNTNTAAGGWEKIIVNLSSLTFTGSMQLRFVVDETNGTDFYDDVAIDDIDVHEQPSCPDPTSLTALNLYSDSAQITWTAGGLETEWALQWGVPGFIPGTGAEIGGSSVLSSTYMVTGLTPNTTYEAYVRAVCSPGDSSAWVGPLSFTTTCSPETIPYIEDFTSGAMSNCWTTSDPSNVFVEATCGSRTNILRFDYSNNAITNVIDASAVPNSVKVSYYIAESVCGNGADAGETFEVSYWDGTQYVVAKTYDAERPDAYTHEYFIVPASALTANFRVKFEQMSGTTDTWMIDSLVVEQGPSCLPVTNLSTLALYSDSAQVTWSPMGLETAWNIEWGTPGFTPGTGTQIGGTGLLTTSYMITGLTPNTNYDVYVQANCGAGDTSFWVGPLSIFTGHCVVNSTNTNYGIANFTTTNGVVNINNTTAPGSYTDYTYMSVKQFIGGTDVAFSITSAQSTAGMGIWIDWNQNLIWDATEQVYASGGYTANGTGTITIPVGTPVGDYRMRVVANYLSTTPTPCDDLGNAAYGEAEDYTFSVITVPTCMPVTSLNLVSAYADSLEISWTAGGVETTWNIEWGAPGFTPGTGAEAGSATTSAIPYTITGLTPSTYYDVYVQAQCSPTDSSYWTLLQTTTLCATITSLPWTEDFESVPVVGPLAFPSICWVQELSATYHDDWETQSDGTNQYLAALSGNSDDYIWTPEFGLTAGVSYEFSFKYNGQGNAEWENYLLIGNSQVSTNAVIVDTIIKFTETAEDGYVKYKYCFIPDSTANYHFGIQIDDNGYNNDFYFDDFMLQIPTTTIGVGGDTTVCQTGGLIDLNNVITITNTDGSWMYFPNPTTIVNDTMFNPEFVPSGVQNVSYYTTKGCYPDTVTAAINIVSPANAGTDGTESTCNYGVFNLFDGLSGSVTLDGQWYDPASQPITGSFVNFNGEIPASYNYIYIVDNATCPGDYDTSIVEIVLTDCAGVDEYALDGFNFYPNPTNGVVNIQYAGKGEDVQINVIDTKGAVVWTKQVQFTDGTTQKIDLTQFENGTYFINMRSKNGAKVMKVVKN